MRIPLSWLAQYVELSLPVDELAQRLSLAGAEVEAVLRTGEAWEQIRVGRVEAVEPHPAADRLRLVTVDIGEGEPQRVVCGAPNVAEGQTVAFAVLGASLIDAASGERKRLRKAKIRGVESAGMVCSERELGLSDEHEGILVLDETLAPGTPLAEAIGEVALEIAPTPNRPDHLSVLGIAREVAALTGQAVREPETDFVQAGPPVAERTSVTIEAADLCARYTAAVIVGITVRPSPDWLQQALRAAGQRPINNVVDVTNYVMLELGQPLHAFDFARLRGGRIVVRRARDGERIRLIDGGEHALTADTLVIADAEQAVAVAGVMGSATAEVGPSTTTMLLESATFDGPSIRRTAARLKQRSEAAIRFEKGLNPELAAIASARAVRLLLETGGGVADHGLVDAYPGQRRPTTVQLPRRKVAQILGEDVPVERVRSVLEGLGFGTRWIPPDRYVVQVPYWRSDVRIAEDVVEEIARIVGYDHLPSRALAGSLPEGEPDPLRETREAARDALAAAGLYEAITYVTTSASIVKPVQPTSSASDAPPLRLFNPMNAERDRLRPTLRPGLFETYAANRRQRAGGRLGLFEVGKVFLAREDALPEERTMLVALLGGGDPASLHGEQERRLDFFDAKAVCEALAAALGLSFAYAPPTEPDPALLPGATAQIQQGEAALGLLGQVDPAVLARFEVGVGPRFRVPKRFDVDSAVPVRFEMEEDVFLIELDVAALAAARPAGPVVRPVSRFPALTEDLAIVVDEATPAAAVEAVLRRPGLVDAVELFDVYRGDQIPAGRKSLAYRVVYRARDRTLTDKDVAKVRKGIVRQLARDLGASIREG